MLGRGDWGSDALSAYLDAGEIQRRAGAAGKQAERRSAVSGSEQNVLARLGVAQFPGVRAEILVGLKQVHCPLSALPIRRLRPP